MKPHCYGGLHLVACRSFSLQSLPSELSKKKARTSQFENTIAGRFQTGFQTEYQTGIKLVSNWYPTVHLPTGPCGSWWPEAGWIPNGTPCLALMGSNTFFLWVFTFGMPAWGGAYLRLPAAPWCKHTRASEPEGADDNDHQGHLLLSF